MTTDRRAHTLAGIFRCVRAGGPGRGVTVNSGEILKLIGLPIDEVQQKLRTMKPEKLAQDVVDSGYFDFEPDEVVGEDEKEVIETVVEVIDERSTSDTEVSAGSEFVETVNIPDEENPNDISILKLEEHVETNLRKEGYETCGSLVKVRDNLESINRVGPKTAVDIDAALTANGFVKNPE